MSQLNQLLDRPVDVILECLFLRLMPQDNGIACCNKRLSGSWRRARRQCNALRDDTVLNSLSQPPVVARSRHQKLKNRTLSQKESHVLALEARVRKELEESISNETNRKLRDAYRSGLDSAVRELQVASNLHYWRRFVERLSTEVIVAAEAYGRGKMNRRLRAYVNWRILYRVVRMKRERTKFVYLQDLIQSALSARFGSRATAWPQRSKTRCPVCVYMWIESCANGANPRKKWNQ